MAHRRQCQIPVVVVTAKELTADNRARLDSRTQEFIQKAEIRPITEIQEQSDLLYRMHWYARNSSLTGKECELSEGIVSERRRAIDWAYGVEEDWDGVPMDT